MKKITMLVAASAIVLSACESAPTVSDTEAHNAIVEANRACAKAKSVNYEWRDACMGEKDKKTDKHKGLLAKAKYAFEEKKYDEAVKLAKKSQSQSETAYAQYEANQKIDLRN